MSDLAKRLDDLNMAFEDGVHEDVQVLYRVVHWRTLENHRLRSTNFYSDEKRLADALERIEADDLISVKEFRLITRPAPGGDDERE